MSLNLLCSELPLHEHNQTTGLVLVYNNAHVHSLNSRNHYMVPSSRVVCHLLYYSKIGQLGELIH